MIFRFKIEKTIEASAVLLKTEANRMTLLRLLKLLYIADREALKERARPITGDRAVAMDHGPVLSVTYNLIKGEDFLAPQWEKYVRREGKHEVALIANPGVGHLSKYEIEKLQAVARQYQDLNEWELSEFTHTFLEWKKNQPPPKSKKDIPEDDILAAVGLSDLKEKLAADSEAEAIADRLFGAD